MNSVMILLKNYENAAILITTLIAGAWIQFVLTNYFRAFKLKRQFSKGNRGEKKAEQYLKSHGFKILGEQSHLQPKMWIDGTPVTFSIRADFLVRKKGRKGIVEVKTGKSVNPASKNTRRQILEYSKYYDIDDIYLFDADAKVLHSVHFSPKKTRTALLYWSSLVLVLITGLAFFIYWNY